MLYTDEDPKVSEATTSVQLLPLSSLSIISSFWGTITCHMLHIASYQQYPVYSSLDLLKQL